MRLRPRDKQANLSRLPKVNYYRGNSPQQRASTPFVKKTNAGSGRRFATKAMDVFLLGVLAAGIIYSLLLSGQSKVIISSQAYHPLAVYQAAANTHSGGVSNRSKLTYDAQSITSYLERAFPEVSAASVELPIVGQTPTIRLSVARPAFLLKSPQGSYILDEDGVAVAPASLLPKLASLLPIDDQSGFKLSPGTRVLSGDNIRFIEQVVDQSKKAKVPVASISLPPLAQEFDLHTADKSYFIKFYLGGDALIQSGQFLAARHQFVQSHIDPVQYVDVRIQGKIFFK